MTVVSSATLNSSRCVFFFGNSARYGEKPDQQKLSLEGDGYWKRLFPHMDYIEKCVLVYESDAGAASSSSVSISSPVSPSVYRDDTPDELLHTHTVATETTLSPKIEDVQVAKGSFSVLFFCLELLGFFCLAISFAFRKRIADLLVTERCCSQGSTTYEPVEIDHLQDAELE